MARFEPEDVEGLPDAARRWLIHSIAPGTPLYQAAVVEMAGEIRIRRWLPFKAVQLHAPPAGYVWAARAGIGLLYVSGFDRYSDGQGQMMWRLFSRLPVVDTTGPDVARSAAGRLAVDAFLVPTAFLAQAVTWLPHEDPSTVTARWSIDSYDMEVDMTVAEDGRLVTVTMGRWGNPSRRPWGIYPFGGWTSDERTFDGVTTATRLTGGWFFGTSAWPDGEFFRAKITDITYL